MGRYINSADLYAEGVSPSYTDAFLEMRIAKWERIVESITRNIFYVYDAGELVFDGSNSEYLHFNIPLVDVSSVKINNSDEPLDAQYYRAFTGKQRPQDDRGNPKIMLTPQRRNIYVRASASLFLKGYDQKITARWGYVDPDPNNAGQYITPVLIQEALKQLVVKDLDGYFSSGGLSSAPVSPIKKERTDDHEIEYMPIETIRATYSMMPRDVQEILSFYRSPLRVAVPDNRIGIRSDISRLVYAL